ncbi:hypothetical protein [Alteromonas sp. 14N.309.X.WAT.G.H12]|uniref:hypothetical protein n=1 Tax=Alteromonas sp. 14N.309.X.WAT.G.H12 TaxID=3120824 RepID=UPI002FD34DA0
MNYFFTFVLTVFVAFNVVAAGSGTGDQVINAIEIDSHNNLRIYLANANHNSTCATSGKEKTLTLPKSDANFDHFLSIALTAQTTGKKVYMWLDNSQCVTEGSTYFPKPMTIILRNY